MSREIMEGKREKKGYKGSGREKESLFVKDEGKEERKRYRNFQTLISMNPGQNYKGKTPRYSSGYHGNN